MTRVSRRMKKRERSSSVSQCCEAADGASFYLLVRPEIPVGDFTVEIVGESVRAEALLPGGMKGYEVRYAKSGV